MYKHKPDRKVKAFFKGQVIRTLCYAWKLQRLQEYTDLAHDR